MQEARAPVKMRAYKDREYNGLGECPGCGATELTYPDIDNQPRIDGNALYFECKCEACGWGGREVYYIDFQYYTDEEKDEDEYRRVMAAVDAAQKVLEVQP